MEQQKREKEETDIMNKKHRIIELRNELQSKQLELENKKQEMERYQIYQGNFKK